MWMVFSKRFAPLSSSSFSFLLSSLQCFIHSAKGGAKELKPKERQKGTQSHAMPCIRRSKGHMHTQTISILVFRHVNVLGLKAVRVNYRPPVGSLALWLLSLDERLYVRYSTYSTWYSKPAQFSPAALLVNYTRWDPTARGSIHEGSMHRDKLEGGGTNSDSGRNLHHHSVWTVGSPLNDYTLKYS